MTIRHDLTVAPHLEGSRLDSCLADLVPEWSRSRARKLIDGGHVTVNGEAARASLKVREDDRIVVLEPPPTPLETVPEDIPLDIVHEDEELLVINKPTGLVIHPAAGNPRGTLVNALLHHCTDLSGIGGVERPGIVHRLDKETTGLLVVAKTDRAHLALSLAFKKREIAKTYLAVCYGVPADVDGVIDAPIDRHPKERQQMAVVKTGRPARTLYHVEEAFRRHQPRQLPPGDRANPPDPRSHGPPRARPGRRSAVLRAAVAQSRRSGRTTSPARPFRARLCTRGASASPTR